MSNQPHTEKLSVAEFSARCREAMVPLTNKFSYFAAVPVGEEDVKEYVEEPVAAIPPALAAWLTPVCIALVPYLERANGKDRNGSAPGYVCFEPPQEGRAAASEKYISGDLATILLAVKDQPVADCHYFFYREVAELAAMSVSEDHFNQFSTLLREELRARVHGEVDQQGWRLKELLMRRQTNLRRETKLFKEYARQAFIDTLTLYLHGICCDIDIEPGPRQLPSRYLRKRLVLLENFYPPPKGYAVFPEEVTEP